MMLTKRGHVTLFVDGFGVELPDALIEGTQLKSGDSVSKETLERLSDEFWGPDPMGDHMGRNE